MFGIKANIQRSFVTKSHDACSFLRRRVREKPSFKHSPFFSLPFILPFFLSGWKAVFKKRCMPNHVMAPPRLCKQLSK